MDLRDTPEEARFRTDLRAWIAENLPEDKRGGRGGAQRFDDPFMREWSRKLYEAGYAGLTWPKEYGGEGAPPSFQAMLYEELAAAQAPAHVGVIGLGMAGPTIIAHGTEEQKARYLQPILSADEIWCQGFSEPDAGSDLAAARTRAERRGDVYVVNGQKVWSSFAHIADFCILVTQSDPDAPPLQEPHLPARRHARARRRGAAAAADHRRGGVQRDLLQRRRSAGREPPGRRGRRLAGGDDDAPARARDARLRAHGDARRRVRAAARGGARARRRPARARRARPRVDRAAGPPLHELPRARHVRPHRCSRPRGLRREVALVGVEPAADEARARAARTGGDPRRRAGGTTSSSAAAATRSRPGRRKCSATSSPSACSGFRDRADGLRAQRGPARAEAGRARLARRPLPARPRLGTAERPLGRAEELGWLDVAEAGLGFLEEAILLEELGYACYPGFYLGHVAGMPGDGDAATVDPTRRVHLVEETPRFRAAVAAEALGVAQRALDLGVEHAKTRDQFGKPIGTYQAVSHPLAQTYTDVELARSLVYWAAWCVANEDERAPLAAAAAKAFATEAAVDRVRALDPGARRHRLHVGAPAPPLLQARSLARGLRRPAGRAAPRSRRRATWGGLGETVTEPQGRAERRDSSRRSSAGYAGSGVLGRTDRTPLSALPASLASRRPSHPCDEHRSPEPSHIGE